MIPVVGGAPIGCVLGVGLELLLAIFGNSWPELGLYRVEFSSGRFGGLIGVCALKKIGGKSEPNDN